MSDLDQYEIEGPAPGPSPAPAGRGGGGSWGGWIAAIAALLALVVFAVWWFVLRSPPAPQAQPPAAQGLADLPDPAADALEPGEEAIELPPIDASDEVVATLVGALSAHPQLVAWLANDHLIRRFVAAVDNLADGISPRTHLPFLRPGEGFSVRGPEGRETIDPRSYRRYDPLVQALTSLDSAGTARLYRQLSPLLAEAYRDLGYADRSFDGALARALGRLLAVPVLDEPMAVTPRVVSYSFADPDLEALSPAAKHLLRMGPENVRRVQAKLRELAGALGIAPLPPPG